MIVSGAAQVSELTRMVRHRPIPMEMLLGVCAACGFRDMHKHAILANFSHIAVVYVSVTWHHDNIVLTII